MVEKIKNSRIEKMVYPDGSAVLRDYTVRGQLSAVRYDAGNRRIAKIANGTTTVFAYSGWRCIEEFDATSTPVALRKFAFGRYLDEPLVMATVSGAAETLHFYHQNANYNVIALTDASGSIADRVAYSSYGQIVMVVDGSTGNPWFYTGQRHDSDTGLDYYKMRYYDSGLGRFVSCDPIASDVNLYEYVGSVPLTKIDLLGLEEDSATLKSSVMQVIYEQFWEGDWSPKRRTDKEVQVAAKLAVYGEPKVEKAADGNVYIVFSNQWVKHYTEPIEGADEESKSVSEGEAVWYWKKRDQDAKDAVAERLPGLCVQCVHYNWEVKMEEEIDWWKDIGLHVGVSIGAKVEKRAVV